MTRFLADEDFCGPVLRRLRTRYPQVDVLTVHDVGLAARPDPEVLAWAAEHLRVVLTHDTATMTKLARERVAAGESLAGVFVVPQRSRWNPAVLEDVAVAAGASEPDEWAGRIVFLPLQ